jgi:FKBP-type peptidyl-prolyl cis-trans isomerase (trigger factor)
LPEGFEVLATTESVPVAAFKKSEIGNPKSEILYGLQFHPEVYHSTEGEKIIKNFLVNICHCPQTWTPANFINETVSSLKQKIGNKKVIMALSGGVDSTVAATLIGKAIGETVVLKLRFPDHFYRPFTFDRPDLYGREAEFEVTIGTIRRMYELTEYIAVSDDYSSIEEFIEVKRKEMEEEYEEIKSRYRNNLILRTLTESSTVLAYPEFEVNIYFDWEKEYDENQAKRTGLSWKDYLITHMEGMTPEMYNEWLLEKVQHQVKQDMIFFAIAKEEGLGPTKDDEKSVLEEMMKWMTESEKVDYSRSDETSEQRLTRMGIEIEFTTEKVKEFVYRNTVWLDDYL